MGIGDSLRYATTGRKVSAPAVSLSDGVTLDDLLSLNPYASVNTDFSDTKKNNRAYENQIAENEYLSQLALMMYENEYNDPSAQVARLRVAGINPDLAGLGDANESASADMSGIDAPADAGGYNGLDVANGVMNFLGTAMSFATGIQGLQAGAVALDAAKLDNVNKMIPMAENAILGGISDVIDAGGSVADLFSNDAAMASLQSQSLPINSRRAMRSYASAFQTARSRASQLASEAYSRAAGREASRVEYNSKLASPTYSESDEAMRDILTPLLKLKYDLEKQKGETELHKAAYDQSVNEMKDPDKEAGAFNARNDQTMDEEVINKKIRGVKKQIVSSLYNDYMSGNMLAGYMLMNIDKMSITDIKSFLGAAVVGVAASGLRSDAVNSYDTALELGKIIPDSSNID